MLNSTFNLCLEHSNASIFSNTLLKFENSILSIKDYINSKNPRKFLKGDLVQKIFKVR